MNQILNLTSELIEIPSVTGDEIECKRVIDVIDRYLGEQVFSKSFKHNGVLSKLWGSNKDGILTPKILLCGHVDVVDANNNPELFIPKIQNQKLIGRGAGDMKGSVAAMAWAYKRFIERGDKSKTIGLLLTSDEEAGGRNGAKYVIEQGLKPEMVFIPDGSSNFQIVESQKTPFHFFVSATGEGGHASLAFRLDNPINRIVAFYFAARKLFSLASVDDNWKSTFEMTIINTPNQSKNKIPEKVTAAFSWRWPLEQMAFKDGKLKIDRLCKKYGITISESDGIGEGCLTDRNEDFVTKWKSTLETALGHKIGFVNMHGATDARHFYNNPQYGTRKVLVTSAITGGHHEVNEWIDIKSLNILAKAVFDYLKIA